MEFGDIKARRLIKVLTPEQVSRALAESLMANAGMDYTGKAKVSVDWVFNRGERAFCQCRVEVEPQ